LNPFYRKIQKKQPETDRLCFCGTRKPLLRLRPADLEETVNAADPESDGEQSDDSDGCIEDSDDLLY